MAENVRAPLIPAELLTADEVTALRDAVSYAELRDAAGRLRARWVADALEAEAADFERRAANAAGRSRQAQRDAERWLIAVEVLRDHASSIGQGREPTWASTRPGPSAAEMLAEYQDGKR